MTGRESLRDALSPLDTKRLEALELLVAIHTNDGEWQTFVALLNKAGYDVRPEGVVSIGR